VTGVQFYLDGSPFGAEDTTSPYTAVVTLSNLSAGSHTMHAVFRNSTGQTAQTQAFTFSASGPVAMSMEASGSTIAGMPSPTSDMPTSSQLAGIASAIETLRAMLASLSSSTH
jgi:hypothetical protein